MQGALRWAWGHHAKSSCSSVTRGQGAPWDVLSLRGFPLEPLPRTCPVDRAGGVPWQGQVRTRVSICPLRRVPPPR